MPVVKEGSAVERLELRYVPLEQAKLWDDNPKRHDIDALVRSIEVHGFGDPPKYDAQLEGLVYGNGRTEALERMRRDGKELPRGIEALEDGGWAIPVIFGVDAESRAAAVAFAIDHNTTTLLGGSFRPEDLLCIWDEESLAIVLGETSGVGDLLASMEQDDLLAIVEGPSFGEVGEESQSRLDRKVPVTCPECGAEFVARK